MANSVEADSTRGQRTRRNRDDFSSDFDDWGQEPKPARDWTKAALVIGLGGLSWVATYVGMLELIEANMGELPIVHRLIIGFAVAMLMTMIIWLLDQLFKPHNFITRLSYVAGYLFLTLISVGFGFGFYWKVLESRSEATRSAESAISQVQSALHGASTRLTQLQTTLDGLTVISSKKAEEERLKGTSCPNSRPGDGPRRKLRDDDAQRFGFAANFVKGRIGSVNGNMKALNADMEKIVKNAKSTFDAKTGDRNDYLRGLGRKLDLTVTGFNAFRTDPQLRQIRADLADRAGRTSFPDTRGGTFSCPDIQLQAALTGVVRAIDGLPELEKPKIAAVEGSEAVIEAFRRLTATLFGAMQLKLPPSPEELRSLQQKAVQSVQSSRRASDTPPMEGAGLSKRDYIPLAIAIFVDLCLLLVSMGRSTNRLENLVPKMRQAERGPVIQILSRFNDIHKDEEVRENFEIFRHVVFDWAGVYYVAVPLDAPYTASRRRDGGTHQRINTRIEDLQQEAHLLANLFASFEKEKIFTRVLMPIFGTKAIQKKLHKQGSKFAGSSSFRVYKFRDGAWSEIILGAVMGAARRVEANKRRRRIEEQIFDSPEPALEMTQGTGSSRHRDTNGIVLPEGPPRAIQPEDALRAMGQVAAKINGHDAHRPKAARPAYSWETAGDGIETANTTGAAKQNAMDHRAHSNGNSHVGAFGAYSAAASAELNASETGARSNGYAGDTQANGGGANHAAAKASRLMDRIEGEADSAAAAANNNTSPALRSLDENVRHDEKTGEHNTSSGAANVIHLPSAAGTPGHRAMPPHGAPVKQDDTQDVTGPRVTEAAPINLWPATGFNGSQNDRVNVELRERTVTYSIPAQEAVLPSALLKNAMHGHGGAQAARLIEPEQAEFELAPPPVALAAPSVNGSSAIEPEAKPAAEIEDVTSAATDYSDDVWDDEASVEITTISRRFAPGGKGE